MGAESSKRLPGGRRDNGRRAQRAGRDPKAVTLTLRVPMEVRARGVKAPAGASLEYTGNVAQQAEKIILSDPDVLALFSVMGFSFSGAASNQGIMFVRLRPFDERPGLEELTSPAPPGHPPHVTYCGT